MFQGLIFRFRQRVLFILHGREAVLQADHWLRRFGLVAVVVVLLLRRFLGDAGFLVVGFLRRCLFWRRIRRRRFLLARCFFRLLQWDFQRLLCAGEAIAALGTLDGLAGRQWLGRLQNG